MVQPTTTNPMSTYPMRARVGCPECTGGTVVGVLATFNASSRARCTRALTPESDGEPLIGC
jgi:hypothetical protein